jgi:hypothetical protein
MRGNFGWIRRITLLAILVGAGVSWGSLGSIQDSKASLFRDLRGARDAYRQRLLEVSSQILAFETSEADSHDRLGKKTTADIARGRRNAVERCQKRLNDDADANLDDVARLLQSVLVDEVPYLLLRDGLLSCLVFRERRGVETKDLVSGGQVAVEAPEWVTVQDTDALAFSQGASRVRVHIPLAEQWTIVLRIHFPAPLNGRSWASLIWNQQAHVILDKSSELGVWQGGFHGSGFKVSSLKGWHTLVARAKGARTTFFVDGIRKGESESAVFLPIECIGNWGSTDGEAQNLDAPVAGVAVFGRALGDDEIAAIKDEVFK